MVYHLERKIRLSEDSEYNSLYKWCLQELDEDDEQIGRDQIPWPWGLFFTGSELGYSTQISGDDLADDEDDPAEPKSVKVEEIIFGALRPGLFRAGNWEDVTTFSMFGTNRTVRHFNLIIKKLKGNDSLEGCRMWGCVSYALEINFRDETEDDVVEVHLSLSGDKFDHVAAMIRAQEVDTVQLRLTDVSGFYSEWSPSTTTKHIKLLAPGSEQKVICREDCEVVPPRLGKVGRFNLQVVRRHVLNLKQGK